MPLKLIYDFFDILCTVALRNQHYVAGINDQKIVKRNGRDKTVTVAIDQRMCCLNTDVLRL